MRTRKTLGGALSALALCMACQAAAQGQSAPATRKAELQALSQELRARADNQRRQARQAAMRLGIPLRRELPDGRVIGLQRIGAAGEPIYYVTNNLAAADTTSTDDVWPGGSAGLSLDGSGMILGIWDESAVLSAHNEFTDSGTSPTRVMQMDAPGTISDHATHVTGTMIASGEDPDARGMASAASVNAYDWDFDAAEMAAEAAADLLLSNHSYGIVAGWFNIADAECNNWWWVGGEFAIEDYKFGYYDSDAQTWDQIAFDAPYYLIVKSAGNDRSASNAGPGENGGHCWLSADETTLTFSTMSRNSDCHDGVVPPGYDCLPTISVAKNILTVGAVDDIPGGYTDFPGPLSVSMTSFSGWGPTDDGRIKPDLVANGQEVYSSVQTWCIFFTFCTDYNIFSGTSMAAPNTTGSLVLLQQHYQDTHGGEPMRSATLKALAIHTADEAGTADGPDYVFGFGLLNTETAARVITEDGGGHRIIEGVLANGGTDTVQINVNEPEALIKATLVWADPPGTPAAPAIDVPDLMLVNDLDLRIHDAAGSHMPWVLDPAVPDGAATRGDNVRDNVEQVVIDGGGPGAYFVEVSHKGTLLDGADQAYSLIISAVRRSSTQFVEFAAEDFSSGLPAGWSVIPSPNNGPVWDIYDDIDGDPEFDNHTGGTGKYAMAHYGDLLAPFDTELRTASYDLSAHQEVTLEFKSHFEWYLLERISVDASTDGGTAWSEVWMHEQAPLLGPSTQAVDLSGVAGGQPDVIIRFQFESVNELDGLLWQVDDVRLTVPDGGNPDDPCGGQYSLPANQWRFVAVPCDPGAQNTVADLFGDDLDVADYGLRWILYARDEANDQYQVLADTAQALNQGEGYFLLSLDSGLLDVTGSETTLTNSADCPSPDGNCYEIPLVKPADAFSELSNALGHPLGYPVDWADFRIRVAGEPDSPLTPSEAHAKNYTKKQVHKYSGSAYVPYDDVTPGYDHGALGAFDAFWLKSLGGSHDPGIGQMTLLVPNIRSSGVITTTESAPASGTLEVQTHAGADASPGLARREAHRQAHREASERREEWYVRLIVESAPEELRDDGNVLGQLRDSRLGFDEHDLPEPAPFTPYLTIVFPQPGWGELAGDYTSDFHPVTKVNEWDEWVFEVRADDPQREVTLSWQGHEEVLGDSLLVDLESGAVMRPDQQGDYRFVMGGNSRLFAWEFSLHPGQGKKRPDKTRP